MLPKLKQRLRSVIHRARFERELDIELQFHLDMLTAQNVARGMTPEAARRGALQVFGAVAGVKDDVRDTWLSRLVEAAVQDVRYGLRMPAAAPAFAVGVMLTIALAVGVNTAIFAMAYSILLKPLPFGHPSELVVLQHTIPNRGSMRIFSNAELHDYARVPSLESIAELHTMWFILLGASAPERVSTGVVSTNYFHLLGVRPLLGRGLLADDEAHGADAVLLLGYEYWQRSFNGDPTVVGRRFEMNDRLHTVVGVLPPFPQYPETVDVYMPTSACPFRASPSMVEGRTMRMGRLIARTRDDVTAAQLASDLDHMASRLRQTYPRVYGEGNSGDHYRVVATPLADEMRATLRSTLWLLVATAGLVLMIACVSISNLALARLTHRAGEVSLRAALGATRGRLVRQLLTENVSVALLGTTAGLVLAKAALSALTAYVQHGTTLPVARGLTGAAIVGAITVSLTLLVVSTVVPLIGRRTGFDGGLPRQQPGRIRYGLVVGQVSLSFVLMIAAVLSVRSLLHLQGIDTGFSTEQVQTMRLDLNFTKYRDYPSISAFWRQFERQVSVLSGVSAAGGAGNVPLDGRPLSSSLFEIDVDRHDDRAPMSGAFAQAQAPRANLRVASPGYFGALGQRVLRGRTFNSADVDFGTRVVVVNDSLARKHWPRGDAVGQRMRVENTSAKVIGVVEDTRQALDQPAGDEIYLPLLATTQLSTNWLVRSNLVPEDVERRVRAIVYEIDPEQPVDTFRSLESFRADSLLPSRVTAGVISSFSLLALIITATGIAGVIGFAIQQRRHEFGVRLALGAQRRRVVGMVLGQALRLVCTGLALGTFGSVVLFPFMRDVLSGIETFDVGPLALVSGVLLVVAAAASFVPARRAATLDPMIALRAN
jgi:putative ABC transport system permease protein